MQLWEGVQEFLMVAQTANFTKAASKLGVSTSHVSRQIAALEDRLGVKLLSRSTRSVKLTDNGTLYYELVNGLFEQLTEANQTVSSTEAEVRGTIRISAAGPFAENHIAPALLEFTEMHPGVVMEITFDNQLVNLVDQGYDFAIRYGDLPDSTLISRKLIERPLVCVAAPSYLSKHGKPEHPRDLKHHACLLSNSDRWIFRKPDHTDKLAVRVAGPLKTNNVSILRNAAERGMGISYSPVDNFQSSLETGRVVKILEGFEDLARPHSIVYPERRHIPLRVRQAIEFLIEKFKNRQGD